MCTSISVSYCVHKGQGVAYLVEALSTTRKAAGSIPNKTNGFINWFNPSSRTMALRSTEPLTEMSSRNLHVGKGRQKSQADLNVVYEPIV
jgi:hypothetical protein